MRQEVVVVLCWMVGVVVVGGLEAPGIWSQPIGAGYTTQLRPASNQYITWTTPTGRSVQQNNIRHGLDSSNTGHVNNKVMLYEDQQDFTAPVQLRKRRANILAGAAPRRATVPPTKHEVKVTRTNRRKEQGQAGVSFRG